MPEEGRRSKTTLGPEKKAREKVRRSTAHEERVAKKTKGWRNPGSGNVRGGAWGRGDRRGDVRCFDFLIEAKRTVKHGYRLTESVIAKAHAEALADGKDWALAVTIEGFERDSTPSKLMVIDEDTFAMLLEKARAHDESTSLRAIKESDEQE
jgi:hypothetical protein